MKWTPNPATLRLQAIKKGKAPSTGKPKNKEKVKQKPDNQLKSTVVESGKKKGKPIKKTAKKRARQNRKYSKLRKEFLEKHEVCEIPVEGCTFVSTQVHHGEGRENERLLDIDKFKAACDNCHRKATDKSRQAIAAGHSGSRLGKPKKK